MAEEAILTEEEKVTENLLQLVSFSIGEEEFGVNILNVKEIIRIIEITRVPNAPGHVQGVINLRGKVVPIINMRKRLGLPDKEMDSSTRIIVVELDSKSLGFIVDKVSEVLRIDESVTEPPPAMTTDIDTEFITGIARLDERILILLDLEKIITQKKKGEKARI